jgi:tight adherence protein C
LLANVESSLRLGRSWDLTLAAFARDVGQERCAWVVGLMRQNLRRGSPLAGLLIEQVEQWRHADAMNAERQAQTLSLKLLLPIFLFLLPAVFLILFAPVLLRFSEGNPLF